jgi:Xaa-Pro aminopeptidase
MMDRIEFTKDEIVSRIRGCQKNMEVKGYAGLVVSAESNLNYYSDFCSHAPWSTFTRPNFLFIPVKGTPRLLVQTFLVAEAEAIAKGCDIRGFDSLLGPTPEELKQVLEDLKMDVGRIGFELGFEQRLGFQVNTYEALKALADKAEFVDAADLIWSQRIIKSTKEIDCIRKACQATSYAHDKVFGAIHEGMSEFEISQLVQQFMLEGGAEYPGFVIITSGEGNYGRISKTNTNRRLVKGDYLWVDLGARYKGYWSDFCRSGEVGSITKERDDLQNTIHEVTMRAADVMKPGLPVADVARACGRELERAGFEATFDCGRMGHGMGLMSTEPPSVTIYDDTILREGMIINLEPGIVTDIGVFDLEENFVITKDGFETLSGGSRKLHLIK